MASPEMNVAGMQAAAVPVPVGRPQPIAVNGVFNRVEYKTLSVIPGAIPPAYIKFYFHPDQFFAPISLRLTTRVRVVDSSDTPEGRSIDYAISPDDDPFSRGFRMEIDIRPDPRVEIRSGAISLTLDLTPEAVDQLVNIMKNVETTTATYRSATARRAGRRRGHKSKTLKHTRRPIRK